MCFSKVGFSGAQIRNHGLLQTCQVLPFSVLRLTFRPGSVSKSSRLSRKRERDLSIDAWRVAALRLLPVFLHMAALAGFKFIRTPNFHMFDNN